MPLHMVSVSQAFPLRDRSISVGGTIRGVNHSFIQSAAVFVLSARPLPRRPAPSPYFQPSGSWRSVSPSKFLGNALQGSRTCLSVSHLTVIPFSASQLTAHSFLFPLRNNEHLQTDRRPLSSGCYHHPSAKNMEKQVLCR
ncbi:hypothetical protein ILYODFUR_038354 [Ilyodon furcidens]|uniref:Uncharacterized protein n=1 Tax=Ilyodon furcidens TaxID=33524 RepID=A0ABV0UEV8_9TELE